MVDIDIIALRVLRQCACWKLHEFKSGPVAHFLMHVVVDASALLRDEEDGMARASVRLVLRSGVVFGLVAAAPRSTMIGVLKATGQILAEQRYDESTFVHANKTLARMLSVHGFRRAQVALEHGATLLPRPLLTAAQIGRLALRALDAVHVARGEAALVSLPDCLADYFVCASSLADPAVQSYRVMLDPHAANGRVGPIDADVRTPRRLSLYNFIAGSKGCSRNRLQALQVLPWLLPVLASPGDGPIRFEVVSICHAIDAGLPLHDAVARALDVPREVVRWLGQRAMPRHWVLDIERLHRLLMLLSWLAPERRPRSPMQFEALTALGNALAVPLGFHGETDTPALLSRYAHCVRRWLGNAGSSCLQKAAAPQFAVLSQALADAGDFLRAVLDAVKIGERLEHETAVDLVLGWCANIDVGRLLSLSRQWHAIVEAANAQVGDIADSADDARELRWPAVLSQPWLFGECSVLELVSGGQLRAEGRRMRHCVASYEDSCFSGSSIVVSVRDGVGNPVSTAELHISQASPGVTAVQHRAADNAAPSASCEEALAALVAWLYLPGQQSALVARRDFQRKQRARGRGASPGGGFSCVARQAALKLILGERGNRQSGEVK